MAASTTTSQTAEPKQSAYPTTGTGTDDLNSINTNPLSDTPALNRKLSSHPTIAHLLSLKRHSFSRIRHLLARVLASLTPTCELTEPRGDSASCQRLLEDHRDQKFIDARNTVILIGAMFGSNRKDAVF